MRYWLMVLSLVAHSAAAQVVVDQAWSRATPPGAKVGVGFMRLMNAGATAERVVGASSPVAGRVEMHVTTREGDVMRMRQIESFEIPAGGSFELKPGGAHLMLMDLSHPLSKGQRVPLTLELENGGELRIELRVAEMGARHPGH